MKRLNYFKRIFKVYFSRDKGYLSFWHETPAVSEGIIKDEFGPYYQTFEDKANYDGPRDESGIIMFDYFFDIGRQYNPLAIAQYGLGRYNLYIKLKTKNKKLADDHLAESKRHADWLVQNLESSKPDIWIWKHKFPWHYKENLKPGWYSAHSQGTGISLLSRMYKETGEEKYKETAKKAFEALDAEVKDGGTKFIDNEGNVWLEEYIIKQPTHILNGFLWALWGVHDFLLLSREEEKRQQIANRKSQSDSERAKRLWGDCVETLNKNLPKYDAGFWSLYDLSEQKMKMIASPFYHSLHVIQLRVMYFLTGEKIFKEYADKFESYQKSWWRPKRAWLQKAFFKLFYF